jgi:hypothetical protein
MADNNELLGAMMLDKAKKDYPYLADKEFMFKYAPAADDRLLEYTPADETQRPDYFPMGKVGVTVFSPKARSIDILGDIASHGTDPKMQAYKEQFANLLDPAMMQERYKVHQQKFKENRPYDLWLQHTGIPEMFRGYTFDQWGPDAATRYTPEQLNILNQVRQHLGIK